MVAERGLDIAAQLRVASGNHHHDAGADGDDGNPEAQFYGELTPLGSEEGADVLGQVALQDFDHCYTFRLSLTYPFGQVLIDISF